MGLCGLAVMPLLPPSWLGVALIVDIVQHTEAWRADAHDGLILLVVAWWLVMVLLSWPIVLRPLNEWWVLKTGSAAPARLIGIREKTICAKFSFTRDGEHVETTTPASWGIIDLRALPDALRAYYRPRAPTFAVLGEASAWEVVDDARGSRA